MTCPGSGDQSDPVRVKTIGEPAEMGTALHELMAEVVQFGDVQDFDAVMRKHGFADEKKRELGFLLHSGRKAWGEYKDFFPEPVCETELRAEYERYVSTGHADVLSNTQPAESGTGRILRVGDWKTTRLEDVNYHAQMMRYLCLAATGSETTFQYVIFFIRDASVIVSPVYARAALAEYERDFEARVLDWDGRTFTTGGDCQYCPRFLSCPAYREIVLSAARDLDGMSVTAGVPLKMAAVVDLADRCRALSGLIEKFRDFARAMAAQSPGRRIVGANGKDLALLSVNKTRLLAKPAWPILLGVLTEDELAPSVEIHKTGLYDTVAKKAGRGKGAGAKRDLVAALEKAGAIEKWTEEQLRSVKHVEASEVKQLAAE